MKKLIGKLNLVDGFGNRSVLKVFTNKDEGIVSYSLSGLNTRIPFSLSNLQCGWRGPALPDNIYEYENNTELFNMVITAVNGGVEKVEESKLFVK